MIKCASLVVIPAAASQSKKKKKKKKMEEGDLKCGLFIYNANIKK